MANSFVRYTGNGSNRAYAINFSYRSTDDLSTTVAGSAVTAYVLDSAGTTLTFDVAPANGAAIEIRRTTSQTAKLVDYVSGAVLTENDLDTDSDQAFYMSQEAIDDADDVIKISSTDFQYDATNKQIRNVANPTSNQDVATKHYLENTFLTTANKTALTTVNANIANINAVNSNSSNINSAVSNATNINTVATNIGSVNTVATDISKVIAVANDLAEAVSEIETVADDLNEASSEIEVVGANIANVNTVGGISANVTTVAGISANVTTVAGNNTNVTTVAGISGDVTTVAGISSDVQAVENISANVTTVAGIDSDVTSVAGISSAVSAVNSNSTNINAVNSNSANINTVSGNNTNISTVAGVSSDVTSVAGIASDVSAVENIASNVTTVAGMSTAINTANSNATNINTVSGAIANVNNVGGSIANVNTVASNLASVNNFGEVYRIASSAPSSSLNSGDLYFNTNTNVLNVYGASGWQNAGSSVNGTSERFKYVASGTPTTFSGADANGNTLSYDAGFIDVYLNGIKMVNGTDVTVTSGSSIVFASALTNGDIVEAVTFGTFAVANLNASSLTSGTVPTARLSGAYTGITQTGTLTSFASTGIDDNATSTAMTISSSEVVSIGTTSTSGGYKVKVAGSLAPLEIARTAGDTVERTQLGIAREGTNVGQLKSDATNLWLEATAGALIINTGGGSERMRIDSSGNIQIAKTARADDTVGHSLQADGLAVHTRDGNEAMFLNRKSSDGAILSLRKDNTEVGSIGIHSGTRLKVDSNSVAGYLSIAGTNRYYWNNTELGAGSDNSYNIGGTSQRFKDLYLSGGVYLGGTGTANKLDDYEEGTFTPAFSGDGAAPSGASYASRLGNYTKIGRMVHVDIWMNLSSWSSAGSGTAIINGLPFTSKSDGGGNYYASGSIGYSLLFDADNAPKGGYVNNANTKIYLRKSSSADARDNIGGIVSASAMNGTEDIMFSLTYQTD